MIRWLKHILSGITLTICLLLGCDTGEKKDPVRTSSPEEVDVAPLFQLLSPTSSGITFDNSIHETKEFNYLKYIYTYNGGGVAIGDVNSDGYEDIYFSGNQASDRLYLNNGGLNFRDATESAGMTDNGSWSTGVCMADINSDGLLDIYVCKSASPQDPKKRKNLVYINQGAGNFSEQGEALGLDDEGPSTQAYFFDYDKDGDLDCYVLNHLFEIKNDDVTHWKDQKDKQRDLSDHLYRNDNGIFTDVTISAGIFNQCWGLSLTIHDYNSDGWPDIYVCNDFREGDLLYINNGAGGFEESLRDYFKHTSFYSMGSDIADLNNDGHDELMVLDMAPASHQRSKQNMAAMRSEVFWKSTEIGYPHQYMFNTLHYNHGNDQYSEIAQLTGLANTDWSWSVLMADYDQDGLRDILVTNGINKDVNDRDFKLLLENRFRSGRPMGFQEAMNSWPSAQISNKAFKNVGNLHFEAIENEWGLGTPACSQGAAYADLDNDGDLDLVINNSNQVSSIYENTSSQSGVTIKLEGPAKNVSGIGSTVSIFDEFGERNQSVYPNRGFQSSVSHRVHFAKRGRVDSISVAWPDGKITSSAIENTTPQLTLKYAEHKVGRTNSKSTDPSTWNSSTYPTLYKHTENTFDDYAREVLLPQKQSGLGPYMEAADFNGDDQLDLLIGGSIGSPPTLLLGMADGKFKKAALDFPQHLQTTENGPIGVMDIDNDGDLDALISSSGNERMLEGENYPLTLMLNLGDGKFQFETIKELPPVSCGALAMADYDHDGDPDVFVGARQVPGMYGKVPESYFLRNDQGSLTVIEHLPVELTSCGMVTKARFQDMNEDGWEDLVICGEWMPVSIAYNDQGVLRNPEPVSPSSGWWYTLECVDYDQDGDIDIIAGNLGANNKFHPSEENLLELFSGDLDGSGSNDIVLAKNKKGWTIPVRGRDCSMEQIPAIGTKFPTYRSFSESDLNGLYGFQSLQSATYHYVNELSSCIFRNDGEGHFVKIQLPIEAQFGPILAMNVNDVDGDGNLDIIAAGGIYDVENETARYDAGQGVILFGDASGNMSTRPFYHGFLPYPVKAIVHREVNGKHQWISVENDGPLRITELSD